MIKRRLIWLLWLLAAFCLYFFENNTGTRIVFAASLLFPILSALCAIWCAEHARYELSVPERVMKDEDFDVRVKVSGSVFLVGCMLRIGLHLENPLMGEVRESELFLIDRSGNIRICSAHCGCLKISVTEPAFEDRFGLFRFPVPDPAAVMVDVTVYPRLTPIQIVSSGSPAGSVENGNGVSRPNGADLTSYNGLREYVPGDPVRQIHWKLSVKTDRLLIRETDQETSGDLLLWLENVLPEADPRGMDQAVTALLSLSQSLCAADYAHMVSWYDFDDPEAEPMPVTSEGDFSRMREALLHTRSGNGAVLEPDFGDLRVICFDPRDPDADEVFEL